MDVRTFTVGPVQENCHIARRDGAREAIVIDPGDEAERLLEAIAALELDVKAILLTHTHFDHVGAEVWCPELEVPVLARPAEARLALGLGRLAARAAARLDRSGGVAAMLRLALALGLGHGGPQNLAAEQGLDRGGHAQLGVLGPAHEGGLGRRGDELRPRDRV